MKAECPVDEVSRDYQPRCLAGWTTLPVVQLLIIRIRPLPLSTILLPASVQATVRPSNTPASGEGLVGSWGCPAASLAPPSAPSGGESHRAGTSGLSPLCPWLPLHPAPPSPFLSPHVMNWCSVDLWHYLCRSIIHLGQDPRVSCCSVSSRQERPDPQLSLWRSPVS